jgi:outer membrane biosynthesis protein TonB
MNDEGTINHTKSKIVFYVLMVHLVVLIFFFWEKRSFFQKPIKKQILVKTYIERPKPILKAPTKKTIKKPRPKKQTISFSQKSKIIKPTQTIKTKKIIKEIEENLKKIEKKIEKKQEIKKIEIPKKIDLSPSLEIEKKVEIDSNYDQILINYLKQNLHLPEYGYVKISIDIDKYGNATNIEIIESKSLENQKYLKNNLEKLKFPIYKEFSSTKKFNRFIICFRNEDLYL